MAKEIIINEFIELLKDDPKLYKRYKKLQDDYYKKIGKDYIKIKVDCNTEPEIAKDILIKVMEKNMCLDEYAAEVLKEKAKQID